MPIVEIDAVMSADASFVGGVTAWYAAEGAFTGDSTNGLSASIAGTLGLSILGNAVFSFNPAKVTVINKLRGNQIPAMAKPKTVPTIRISPPAPVAHSFSVRPVSSNRRREGA